MHDRAKKPDLNKAIHLKKDDLARLARGFGLDVQGMTKEGIIRRVKAMCELDGNIRAAVLRAVRLHWTRESKRVSRLKARAAPMKVTRRVHRDVNARS